MDFKTIFRVILLTSISTFLHASPGFHEPWGKDSDIHYQEINETPLPSRSFSPMIWAVEQVIRFHQNVISPVDGPRSHFRPSSSQYMLQAVQKHGFLPGVFMGFDRLLRENSDEWVYKTTEYQGALYKYDPPP